MMKSFLVVACIASSSDAFSFGILRRHQILTSTTLFESRHDSVDRTIGNIRSALTSRPNEEPLLFNLGMLELQRENSLEALAAFELAVRFNAGREASWYQIGTIKQGTGDIDGAIGAFQKAIEVTVDETIAIACYNNIVEMLLSTNRLEEAAVLTNEAVNKYPESVISWTNMGIVLRMNKSFDWSRMCFENAVKCAEAQGLGQNSGLAVAYNNLGSLCWQDGQLEQACNMYAAALAADDGDESSAYNLAVLLRDRGDFSSAFLSFQRCLAINPDNKNAHFQLAALSGAGTATSIDTSFSGGTPGSGYEQCPAEYVADLFDHYANNNYDQHMLSGLLYRVPDFLWDAYAGHIQNGQTQTRVPPRVVVDLGVGTGLVGRRFREGLRGNAGTDGIQFWGCDLSSEMVMKAYELTWGGPAGTNGGPLSPIPLPSPVYADLAVADCAEYLEARAQLGSGSSVDLVLAGDVVGYVGRLDRLFASVHAVLAPHGAFVFSAEKLGHDDGADDGKIDGTSDVEGDLSSKDGYALRASARFAHSATYIKRTAVAAGLAVRAVQEVPDLRTEGGVAVAGYIVVLQRADCGA